MDCRMPCFLVHHQLLETAQTHVHGVSDAIQQSYPLTGEWWITNSLLFLFSRCHLQLFGTHGLHFAKLSCPSPFPAAPSHTCPLSWKCHPTISSSVIPFSYCRQSFPALRLFSNELALCIRWPKCRSFSFSISPSNDIQDWYTLGCTGWMSLQSKGLSRVFSNTTVEKHQFFGFSLQSNSPTLRCVNNYWNNHSFDYTDIC